MSASTVSGQNNYISKSGEIKHCSATQGKGERSVLTLKSLHLLD